ncbi:hypothetical protein GC105_14085 [Alkalibaculum sp. M08DMB]|uniref:Cyclodeaminase/cyclohydrolase domain-containing protein n=1 Tax=Alkalibaculum sporogenes TaxID=2655001 RepID=A0A6A7KC87_9FIRM|nr:cyclodeaminase/cyclohydrolase family protein [Alkalibaculum sporogenes]MPW26911.1 hypothetical protein [Alkalibaculum sporogenes]
MAIADQTIRCFLNGIAKTPSTPAGGSIAALSAASATAMAEMTIRHSLDQIDDPKLIKDLNKLLLICSFYKEEFLLDMDRDTKCFHAVIKAKKLEVNNEDEKKAKNINIQNCYKEAVNIPLEITYKVQQLLEVIAHIIDIGNDNYLSDGVAAFLLAKSTMNSLLYHMKFNLIFIDDTGFVDEVSAELELLKSQWNSNN